MVSKARSSESARAGALDWAGAAVAPVEAVEWEAGQAVVWESATAAELEVVVALGSL